MPPLNLAVERLVSVVVPAFNAAGTLHATVVSVLNQTYRNIEIIIVDDGSTDLTQTVACALVRRDQRVRYIYQQNGGVASARNRGTKLARGQFIATLDADDLWCPTKVAKQLERFDASGPDTALVYAWCCWIDDGGSITGCAPPARLEGRIFREMCLGNVIVSASNAIIRREALVDAGGFDESLRSRGGQGCEDLKLYLKIAANHEIAMVPEYLIGYRVSPDSMSHNFQEMMRSRQMVEDEFLKTHPDLVANFCQGELILARALAQRAIASRQFRAAFDLLMTHRGGRLKAGLGSLVWMLRGLGRRLVRFVMPRARGSTIQFLGGGCDMA